MRYFQEAIQKDPNHAEAHAGLAAGYCYLGFFQRPKEAFPEGRLAALKTLEIDDAVVDAHQALASLKLCFYWDWTGAEDEMRRVAKLDPSRRLGFAGFFVTIGRFEEGIAAAKRRIDIDPLSFRAHRGLGWTHLYARR